MREFRGEHGIVSDIGTIALHGIHAAYERMPTSDGECRFVIDLASLK